MNNKRSWRYISYLTGTNVFLLEGWTSNMLRVFFEVIVGFLSLATAARTALERLHTKKTISNASSTRFPLPLTDVYPETTTASNAIFQTLATRPNSYLYNPDDDDDIILSRVKRDPAPFVCKGRQLRHATLFYLVWLQRTATILIGKTAGFITFVHQAWTPLLCVAKEQRGIRQRRTATGRIRFSARKAFANGIRSRTCEEVRSISCLFFCRDCLLRDLVTLFATDAALAWRAKKRSTTLPVQIKVDSNFSCEYDAEGVFPGRCPLGGGVPAATNFFQIRNTAISFICVALASI